MKNKFIGLALAAILAFAAILAVGLVPGVSQASPDGVNILGPGDAVGGVYITPGSRARDLVSGNHKAFGIDQSQNLLVSNGDIETAWSGSSTSAVNATPAAIVIAAATSTIHCLTSIDFSNFHNDTGTKTVAGGFIIEVIDGTAATGTVKWSRTLSWPAVANGVSQSFQWHFPTPIKTTAGNALTIRCNSAVLAQTGESINVQGYSIK